MIGPRQSADMWRDRVMRENVCDRSNTVRSADSHVMAWWRDLVICGNVCGRPRINWSAFIRMSRDSVLRSLKNIGARLT